jgi:hypothetical protein
VKPPIALNLKGKNIIMAGLIESVSQIKGSNCTKYFKQIVETFSQAKKLQKRFSTMVKELLW